MRILFNFSIFVIYGIFCFSAANATTRNAVSCSFTDIQAEINAASIGDTIMVPSGNCTWSEEISLNKELNPKKTGVTGKGTYYILRGHKGSIKAPSEIIVILFGLMLKI